MVAFTKRTRGKRYRHARAVRTDWMRMYDAVRCTRCVVPLLLGENWNVKKASEGYTVCMDCLPDAILSEQETDRVTPEEMEIEIKEEELEDEFVLILLECATEKFRRHKEEGDWGEVIAPIV